jgi:amino acid transporter
VAVLYIGIATSLGSLLDLDALIKLCTITAIIASLAVVGGPVALRWKRPDIARPFRMWLYPLPCLLAAAGWVYVATTNGLVYIGSALGVLGIGAGAYFWRAKRIGAWPWGQQPSH